MSTIESIFMDFELGNGEPELSLGELKENLESFENRILLYGAGSAGSAFLYYLRNIGIEPLYFIDGNTEKKGTFCEGVEIITISDIIEKAGEDALIIVTINSDGHLFCKSFDEALRIGGYSKVYETLHSVGCKNVMDYTYFRRCYRLFEGDRYNLPACSDVYQMLENRDKICKVYEILKDEESKKTFSDIVRFRLLDSSIQIKTYSQKKQYFEYDFWQKTGEETVVDCGAYNGISLKTFLEVNDNKFKLYYALEPDDENYKKLEQYIETLSFPPEKIKRYHCAVSEQQGFERLYELHGPGSFIADIGKKKIECRPIDDILQGEAVDYIKMNIEGAEVKALRGARATISNFAPNLAVAGYHKTSDLWEIPLLLKEYNSTYQIHLRSYMNHISFVYYCHSL